MTFCSFLMQVRVLKTVNRDCRPTSSDSIKKGLLLWVMLSKPNYIAGGLLCMMYHITEEITWAGRGEKGLKEKLIPLGITFSFERNTLIALQDYQGFLHKHP